MLRRPEGVLQWLRGEGGRKPTIHLFVHSPHPHQHILSVFFTVTILMGVVVILVCIFLMINEAEPLFMCSLAIYINMSSLKNVYLSLFPIF